MYKIKQIMLMGIFDISFFFGEFLIVTLLGSSDAKFQVVWIKWLEIMQLIREIKRSKLYGNFFLGSSPELQDFWLM